MFRRYFIAGLVVLLPIWITLLTIRFMVDFVDESLSLLPNKLHPDILLGVHIPGLGLIFTLFIVLLTGMLVTNFVGTWFLDLGERLLSKIPLVRSIYTATKKVLNTMFAPEGEAFRKVLLIEYPRRDCWTIAFQTSTGFSHSSLGENYLTVFVPTTPNPTAGFLMMLSRDQVKELDMTVDQAIKYIISLGVVAPNEMSEQKSRMAKESM